MDIKNTQWDFYANGQKGVLNIKDEVEKNMLSGDLFGTPVSISWDEGANKISFAREIDPGKAPNLAARHPLLIQFFTGYLTYDSGGGANSFFIMSGLFDQVSYLMAGNHGRSTHSWAATYTIPG
ncbi:MAG: hypothetical protein M0Z59_05740 [Nitrospiraceae bacterium]|nr:hypothetical protein [Nitrospiraceae bacterium]